MARFYAINAPDVSAEVFDLEVIAVNLINGHYHSLRDVACQVWMGLMAGHSIEGVTDILARGYPDKADAVAADVEKLVAALEAAQLIVRTSARPEAATAGIDFSLCGSYAAPVLESYTDMQELLLIDPIHEVDILAGWPHKPDDAKAVETTSASSEPKSGNEGPD